MNILVTGSTGFVGKNLIKKLIDLEYKILEVTRDLEKSHILFKDNTIKLSIDDSDFKLKIAEFKPEVVIHLAAHLTSSDSTDDIYKLLDSNIVFTTKILDSVYSIGSLKLFLNTGTCAEYAKNNSEFVPAYFYAATKTASRFLVDYYSNTYGFNQATVIPYTIYGGADSQKKIIDLIFDSITGENFIDLTPGEQILDFIHIEDVVDFYIHLLQNIDFLPKKSNFYLGSGTGISIRKLAQLIENLIGCKSKINWGAKDYRKSDIMEAVADVKDAKNIFGWKPKVKLEDGIHKMYSNRIKNLIN